jgi:hypothetical protein
MAAAAVKRPRGRPTISDLPGDRFMVHLPPGTAKHIKEFGEGSISRGILKLYALAKGVKAVSS